MHKDLVRFCLEKGFLLDEEVLKMLSESGDLESAKLILEKIKGLTQKKIITREIFEDKEKARDVFYALPEKNQKQLERLKIKLGLEIEISKEIVSENLVSENQKIPENPKVKIFSMPPNLGKKLEVGDFTEYFKDRFNKIRNFLQESAQLNNLVSIGKLYGKRQGFSIIGIIRNKRVTKNKNLLFEIEDLTGKIKVVVNSNKKEIYEKAEDICLDSVIGFKGSGSSEIVFANDIIFPDVSLAERKKSNLEEYALFIGDLHYGSKFFLKESFLKFLDYLNGKVPNTPEVEKIKYLFIVGDVVTGIGNYPNQERDLEIFDLEEQFLGLANLFKKIRKDISIIISPGNHDGVRLMEPQPPFDEKYAWPLYELDNVILTTNPAYAKIGFNENFSGFDVLTYHGFSFPYYANNISKLIVKKAMNFPDLIMKYLLKNRHLAPSYTSNQFFPTKEDFLVISKVPDIFVAAHTHKSAVSYHNNILLISTSCWEGLTPYQEKFGNNPDHCKVPMLNLKTREVKILDFEEEEKNANK